MILILSVFVILVIPFSSYIGYNYYKYKNLRKFKQTHHKPPKGDKIIISFDNLTLNERKWNHIKIWFGICLDPMDKFIESERSYQSDNTKIMLWFRLQFVSEKGSDSENNFKECCKTMKNIRVITLWVVGLLIASNLLN